MNESFSVQTELQQLAKQMAAQLQQLAPRAARRLKQSL
jgi:hypothetical protein